MVGRFAQLKFADLPFSIRSAFGPRTRTHHSSRTHITAIYFIQINRRTSTYHTHRHCHIERGIFFVPALFRLCYYHSYKVQNSLFIFCTRTDLYRLWRVPYKQAQTGFVEMGRHGTWLAGWRVARGTGHERTPSTRYFNFQMLFINCTYIFCSVSVALVYPFTTFAVDRDTHQSVCVCVSRMWLEMLLACNSVTLCCWLMSANNFCALIHAVLSAGNCNICACMSARARARLCSMVSNKLLVDFISYD